MSSIAELVKQLRERTNAGFMACKKALEEVGENLQAAEEYLRKKGLMDASKKSTRTAKEGLVSCEISSDLTNAVIVELNSETDFVAKNEKFQDFAVKLTNIALVNGSENLINAPFGNNRTVQEELSFLISIIGENIQFRRARNISVKNGIIGTYTHKAVKPKLGSIGVLVGLESEDTSFNKDEAILFGKKLAMHIAANNPVYVSIESIPLNIIEKEKEIAKEQAISSGKPENIAEKIAEGMIKKFYKDVVFLEQNFFEDDKLTVSQIIEKYNKEHNTKFKVVDFVRFQVGETLD